MDVLWLLVKKEWCCTATPNQSSGNILFLNDACCKNSRVDRWGRGEGEGCGQGEVAFGEGFQPLAHSVVFILGIIIIIINFITAPKGLFRNNLQFTNIYIY